MVSILLSFSHSSFYFSLSHLSRSLTEFKLVLFQPERQLVESITLESTRTSLIPLSDLSSSIAPVSKDDGTLKTFLSPKIIENVFRKLFRCTPCSDIKKQHEKLKDTIFDNISVAYSAISDH